MTATENHSKLHCNIERKKIHYSPNVLLESDDLAFLCNSHTKLMATISNIQYKKALLFKLFALKVMERTNEKNCLWDKNELLEASQSWKTSIFIPLVWFSSSKPSTCIGIYALCCFNKNRNSCVFPTKSKCDHFLRSPFIRSCKIECYKMVDRPTFQHVLPVCM